MILWHPLAFSATNLHDKVTYDFCPCSSLDRCFSSVEHLSFELIPFFSPSCQCCFQVWISDFPHLMNFCDLPSLCITSPWSVTMVLSPSSASGSVEVLQKPGALCTPMKLNYSNQFRKNLERKHLIHLSSLEQDPINLNNSLVSICLACFSNPPRMENSRLPRQSTSPLSLLENSPNT